MVIDSSDNNKRIAKNTIVLYVRMIFIMAIHLYTSRKILEALGVEDYGIYNVIGGFVVMFKLISNSLTAAISRFITFETGRGNINRLKTIFSTSVNIQILLAITIFILLESFGLWFLYNKMTIPENRLDAAFWVFQFSVFTFCVNLITVPYNAVIIAHEKMSAFAYISILDNILQLCICLSLFYINSDLLIIYAILMALEAVFIRFVYTRYCKKNFTECVYSITFDKALFKQIFAFSGWNFIGASSSILRSQGGNLLLNVFFGPHVNAARGISMNVSSAVLSFSNNFITAINPQITKHYACGNFEYSFRLVIQGAKYSFYLLLFIAIPLLIETETVLNVWLTEVPPYAVLFSKLVIVFVLVENLSNTMITLMLATGNIRNYQIVVGGIQSLNFPVSWLFFKLGAPPQYTLYIAIFLSFICIFLRLIMLRKMVKFPIWEYVNKVMLNVFFITVISLILPLAVHTIIPNSMWRFIIILLISWISIGVSGLFVGCNRHERNLIMNYLMAINKKMKHLFLKR